MQKLEATGYVIHRRAYRETSMMIDFFTQEYGKLSVVAKGVRGNTKSDKKSVLQVLQLVRLECKGRTSLKNLSFAEQAARPFSCSGKALYCAFYINELLQRALPESESIDALFAEYENTLLRLSNVQTDENQALEPILRDFEFSLLDSLGYLVDFSCDASTGDDINVFATYEYINEYGFVACAQDKPVLIQGQIIHDLRTQKYNRASLQLAKYITRSALPLVIGDKPLKSRELFI